ncbi:hypothetical protein LXN57_11660 [Actinoplanes sp. TRM88002]|uniref:Uncharacterized protein n=1 Tax=Paractinoplanes hotanensis TaxID=2906497 RepID=A0ABT0XWQ7_9ACTN|nr:hypothetical protein [Actinoplanes hotanensis]MCM4078221.1 hypothetical protein [Actinoplanes hotanensis]
MSLLETGDGVGDQLVAGGVEVEQGVADGGFEVVGVEAVDIAAGFVAVAGAAPAGVVAVGLGTAGGSGADVPASALRATDQPGEGVGGRIGGALTDVGGAPAEDVLSAVELDRTDDRLVGVRDDDVAPGLFAEVDPVGQGYLDGVL